MITCEEFESRFPFDKSPEVLLHQKTCPFCANFNLDTAILRKSLAMVGTTSISLGFETRLHQKIRELESGSARQWNIMPKTLAFATGVTFVLIAGALYMDRSVSDNAVYTDQHEIEEIITAEAVLDSVANDSLNTQAELWEYGWNLETVSSQP